MSLNELLIFIWAEIMLDRVSHTYDNALLALSNQQPKCSIFDVSKKIQALENDTSLSIVGSYQTMKEVKKKENWKKLYFKLEKGILSVYKNLKVSFFNLKS